MSRTKKTDCWSVSVRISIPIDATKPETIAAAQQRVRYLATLIPGSSVEITHAGFGRMVAAGHHRAAIESAQALVLEATKVVDGAVVSVTPPANQEAANPHLPPPQRHRAISRLAARSVRRRLFARP